MKYLWIFDADAVAAIVPLAGALGALGGSGIKALRRFGVSILIALSAASMGHFWILCVLQAVLTFAAASLPYGDDAREVTGPIFYWPYLFFVGSLFGASLLPLAFLHGHFAVYGVMCGVCSLTFGITAIGSQAINFPKWKWCEIITWAVVGYAVYRQII